MDIAALVGGTATSAQSDKKSSEVNQEDFLTLLTTQLRNQNPLEPVQDSEFLGQLAQFSSLEESKSQTEAIERLASSVAAQTGLQSLSQAAGLIGKHVKYYDENSDIVDADITGVEFTQNGLQLNTADGAKIPLGLIASITETGPATTSTTAADPNGETQENSTTN